MIKKIICGSNYGKSFIFLFTFVLSITQVGFVPNRYAKGYSANQNPAKETETPWVTVHGTVKDTGNQPLRVFIGVTSLEYRPLGDTMSDGGGNYSVKVPYEEGYLIQAQGADKQVMFGPDIIPTGHLDQYQYAATNGEEAVANFSLQPAGSIWLKTYDLAGNYLFRQDINNNNWTVGIYPLGEPPTSHPMQYANHQTNTFWGWRNGSDKNHPVLLIPADKPVELWVYFYIPEFGETYIHLDNDGQGYQVEKGGVAAVNLLYDAAKTEYRIYQERLKNFLFDGFLASEEITDWITEADLAMEEAKEQCPAGNMADCTSSAYTVLTHVIRAREETVFQAAQQDIEKNRKSNAQVQILDCDGSPMGDASVEYRQKSHDFLFGAGWPENNQLSILEQAGFNGAIQEAWWGEVTPDGYNYNFWDDRFSPITARGMQIIMHTGVWISPNTNPNWYFYPRVIEDMKPEEIAELAGEFSYQFTHHYKDRMAIYNAFNEPQNAFYAFPLSMDDVVRIAAESVAGAVKGDPNVPMYINFYNAYLGGDMSWYVNANNETYPAPVDILREILRKEIPFTDIGLEFYSGISPSTDFGIYNDTLEYYGKFGKQVFISEVSYGSEQTSGGPAQNRYYGTWHESHTEATQAEWAKYAFTIAFSKPYTTGIVWVPGSDTNTSGGLKGYGLFDNQGKPRPLVTTIEGLIRSWTTNGSGLTDNEGIVTMRGFNGKYELRWNDLNGSMESFEIELGKDTQNKYIVHSTNCPFPIKTPSTIVADFISEVEKGTVNNSLRIIGMIIVLGITLLILGWFVRRRKSSGK